MKKTSIFAIGAIGIVSGIVIGVLNGDKIRKKINQTLDDIDDLCNVDDINEDDIDPEFDSLYNMSTFDRMLRIFKTPGKKIKLKENNEKLDNFLSNTKNV